MNSRKCELMTEKTSVGGGKGSGMDGGITKGTWRNTLGGCCLDCSDDFTGVCVCQRYLIVHFK